MPFIVIFTSEYRAYLQLLVVRLHEASYLAAGEAVGERVRTSHNFSKGRRGYSPFQTSRVTIEVVLVPGSGTRICVLPECMVLPPFRQSADGASVMSDPQRIVRSERGTVAGASLPPIGGGIDHRVTTNMGVVGVGEIPDPADHRGVTQSITSVLAVRVICPMNDVR